MKLYPLKFEKVLIPKVWGGRNLETRLGIKLEEDIKYGESWEVSSHKNGMSVISNGFLKGKTLEEVYKKYRGEFIGDRLYNKYGDRFPLLIKYLDINDRLSIQVHPDDEYSLKKHNELGKYETWYVIYASEDAKLIMGMKDGYTKDKFLEKARKNDFSNMFKEVRIKTGDIVDVIPGTVHASLQGSIIIAEIQENSDITYRIYDFDREENGKKRELHIEEASNIINFKNSPDIRSTDFNGKNKINISSTPYYNIDKIKIDKFYEEKYSEILIFSILDGEGKIEFEENTLPLKKGETILIPSNVEFKILGNLEVLRTFVN